MTLSGRVVTGRGEAAGFTRLDWVRAWFIRELGIDPYPGTLNLVIETDADRDAWTALTLTPGLRIDPPDPLWCGARAYAVGVDAARADRPEALRDIGALPAAVVVPEVPGYPSDQVELIAPLALRDALSLSDGDRAQVAPRGPVAARAVIFDVDGTLVDSLAAYRVVAERAAEPYRFPITDAMVREALNTSRYFWEIAVPHDCADREAVMTSMTRAAARMWPEVLREHGRVFAHASGVLRALRDAGFVLGIVTGSRRGSIEPLRDAGLLDLFDAVITGEQVQRRKPDPEGLGMCVEALGVGARDAVYVGDTPLDIAAARAIGMPAIGVLTGACDSAGFCLAGADHVISALDRLRGVVLRPDTRR